MEYFLLVRYQLYASEGFKLNWFPNVFILFTKNIYPHNISADEDKHFHEKDLNIEDGLSDSSESGSSKLQFKTLTTKDTSLHSTCDIDQSCNPRSKYRNVDGSCNNEIKPKYGKSNTPLQRLLAPAYKNGS